MLVEFTGSRFLALAPTDSSGQAAFFMDAPVALSSAALFALANGGVTKFSVDKDGNVAANNVSGANTGDVTLAAVGSTPSANGASLSGQVLTLQPADATHPGLVTTGSQTLAGVKTLSSAPVVPGLTAAATAGLALLSNLAAGDTGTDLSLNTGVIRTAGLLLDIDNHGAHRCHLDYLGNLFLAGGIDAPSLANTTGASSATVSGAVADGNTAVGVILDNAVALSNGNAKLASIRNHGDEKAFFGTDGGIHTRGNILEIGTDTGISIVGNKNAASVTPDVQTSGFNTRSAGVVFAATNGGSTRFSVGFQGQTVSVGAAVSGQGAAAPAGAGHVATDASLVNSMVVSPAGTTSTIDNPTNPTAGQKLTYVIRNASGAGTTTSWDNAFKMAAWVDAANGAQASITFLYDGTHWVEIGRSAVTVPN